MAAKKNRAPELDFLRGFALLLMFIQHVSYDLKYEFGVPGFNYLESNWFWAFVHPSWLVIFVGVSGICCTFSRNNLKRGLKLLAVAAGLTLGTYLITRFAGINCLIIFNVLALLSLSILLYTFVQFIEKKAGIRPAVINVLLGAFGVYFTVLGGTINLYGLFNAESDIPACRICDKECTCGCRLHESVSLAGCFHDRMCYWQSQLLRKKVFAYG